MLILIVAATAFEVDPLANSLGHKLDILITGPGMVPTAFALGRQFSTHKYDLVINLGIAGSFDKSISPGYVVEIIEDIFSETGAEDDQQFIPITTLGFGENTFKPTTTLANICNTLYLTQAKAITVNTVHGNEESIKKIQLRLKPQIESMEGAAFFYACRQFNMPCLQIRAVSNYVEKRNRDNWDIPLAIKNLNNFAIELINRINN